MKYLPEEKYRVQITLVDKTEDVFSLQGDQVEKLRKEIFTIGYIRTDKDNKGRITKWISPFVIVDVVVSQLNITLTHNTKAK